MEFKKSLLIGMVKPFPVVDDILRSQGFSRRGSQTVIYDIRIADSACHTVYYLRIPARETKDRGKDGTFLKLDRPYIGKRQGSPSRFQQKREIPPSIVEAAQHKVEEIASYLKTTSPK